MEDEANNWLQEACDAAIRGNVSQVCACLGCEANSSSSSFGLDDPLLLPPPPRVQQIQELLFSSTDTNNNNATTTTFHPQHAFRALLMIPPFYEAPWSAACDMIEKSLHQTLGCLGVVLARDDDKALLSLVTEIQSFFHQTVAVWWELERRLTSGHVPPKLNKTTSTTTTVTTATTSEQHLAANKQKTPRQMLLRLAKIVMSPLVSPMDTISGNHSRDNRRWTLPLELITTIVSLFRDLEESTDQSLVSQVLDVVFDDDVRPSCLLPWMTVVSDLRNSLRALDWIHLRDLLLRSLTCQQQQQPTSIDLSDLPGLGKAIVTLVSSNERKESIISQEDDQKLWQQLILHVLKLAASNDAILSTVETVLQSSFATVPLPMLHRWLPDVDRNDENEEQATIPDWIKVHLILLVSQASGQSGSQLISHLVAKALGVDGRDDLISQLSVGQN